MKYSLIAFTAFLLITLTSETSTAQVSLQVGNMGSTSFSDGLAGPGWALEQYFTTGYASKSKNSNGNTVPGTNTSDSAVLTEHAGYGTNYRILGGYYGVEAILPIVDVNVTNPHIGKQHTQGFGDFTFAPFMVRWGEKKIAGRSFYSRATLDIGFPTGKYSNTRVVNLGNNAFNINPWYAVTFYPVKDSRKFEISARFHYLWTGENSSPLSMLGYKSIQQGQALHENYSASYQVANGVRVGFNGYAVNQITNHKINGTEVANSKERVFGNGVGLQFGLRTTRLYVNTYMESGARNRSEGYRVSFRLLKLLGGAPAKH